VSRSDAANELLHPQFSWKHANIARHVLDK